MKNYIASTKVNSKLATSIPSAIRTKFEIKAGNTLYWDIINNQIIIKTEENK